jgi:cytosine/adenosine deaminase-related metal-dependent hydrolase
VGKLDMDKVKHSQSNLTIGTDGLSSNMSLNLWDEMRSVLLTHTQEELNGLARKILTAVTRNGARALNVNCGEIKKGTFADFIVCALPQDLQGKEDCALQLILHTKQTHITCIAGEIV